MSTDKGVHKIYKSFPSLAEFSLRTLITHISFKQKLYGLGNIPHSRFLPCAQGRAPEGQEWLRPEKSVTGTGECEGVGSSDGCGRVRVVTPWKKSGTILSYPGTALHTSVRKATPESGAAVCPCLSTSTHPRLHTLTQSHPSRAHSHRAVHPQTVACALSSFVHHHHV
jgi:hypothetical protein